MKYYFLAVLFVLNLHAMAQMTLIELTDIPTAIGMGPVSFFLDGKLYVGGGKNWDNGEVYDEFWAYDPSDGTWEMKDTLPNGGHHDASTVILDGIAYLFMGGRGDNGFTKLCAKYDPILDEWSSIQHFPGEERRNHFSFALGEKIYLGAGYKSWQTHDDFYSYDPVLDSWSQLDSLPFAARSATMSFTNNGMAYVGGGWSTPMQSNFKDFYQFNPDDETWQQIEDYPGGETHAGSGFSRAGISYAGFGMAGQNSNYDYPPIFKFWSYTPSLDQWTLAGEMEGDMAYFRFGTVSTDGQCFYAIGAQYDEDIPTNKLYAFCNDCEVQITGDISENVGVLEAPPGGVNHTWYLDGIAIDSLSGENFITIQEGEYVVSYQDMITGCEMQSEVYHWLATGFDHIKPWNNSDKIHFNFIPEIYQSHFYIYNMSGQLVKSGRLINNSIDLSGLSKSIYILQMGNERYQFSN